MTKPIFKDKNGNTKYYASYRSAWEKAIKLNQNETNGQWLFEMDATGWFLEFHSDDDL